MKRGLIAVLVATMAATAPACRPSYVVEGPGAYSHRGVVVTPQLLEVRGKKLRLRFTFANHTDEGITVDRDQMALVHPDGHELARFKGTFGGITSGAHQISAGSSHDVFLDFLLEEEVPSRVSLRLSGVIQGGNPMKLPDYELAIQQD